MQSGESRLAGNSLSNKQTRRAVTPLRTDTERRTVLRAARSSALTSSSALSRSSISSSYRHRHGMNFQVFTPILEEPPAVVPSGRSSASAPASPADAAPRPATPPPAPLLNPLKSPTSASGFFYFKDVVEAQARGDILAVSCVASPEGKDQVLSDKKRL